MDPCIRVTHVSKRFRFWSDRPKSIKTALVGITQGKLFSGKKEEFLALDDISFDVYPGEFVGIMGRNGAGKSTLLKLISGIYTPSAGTIEIKESIAPLIELGAGFDGDLSGYENVFLNAAILGLGKKATQAALAAILEFSELGDKIYMPVKNYSSGMLVRLGFSIAVNLPAPILLVDEVLAVGDMGFQKKCIQKIKSLHQAGRTLVLITHSPDAVRQVCGRLIVIGHKKKIYDGPVQEGIAVYLQSVQSPTTP